MKDNTIDLTRGGIPSKLLRFMLPVLLGNLIQEMYTLADTFIVGRLLGVNKLAAVGVAVSPHFFATGFIIGLFAGCGVVISQHFGNGDMKGVKRAAAAAAMIASALMLLFTTGFCLAAEPLLRFINATPDVFDDASIYLRILYLGLPAVALYNLLASALRAVGDSKTPLYMLIGSSLLNIALDTLFIGAFKMDVAGAAAATVISQLVSGLLCLLYTLKRARMLIPERDDWRSAGIMARSELKIGVPLGFQWMIIAGGWMLLQGTLSGLGADATAAYTIVSRINSLVQNMLASVGTVMATFVGQNAGAKKYSRIRTGVRYTMLASFIFAAAVGLMIYVFARELTLLFIDRGAAEAEAVSSLVKNYTRISSPCLWLLGVIFIYRSATQGLGDGIVPMISSVVELSMRWLIPVLFVSSLGFDAFALANSGAWLLCAILVFTVYTVRMRARERGAKAPAPHGGA